MKKISVFLFGCFFIAGLVACKQTGSGSSTGEEVTSTESPVTTAAEETTSQSESTVQAETQPLSVEEVRAKATVNSNQPNLHLYKRDSGYTLFTKLDNYQNTWIYYNDIGEFYAIPSEEAQLPYSDLADNWLNWWNAFTEGPTTKIGYEVKIKLQDGTEYVETLISPQDTSEIFDYVEVYLYDDIHQEPGAWYSHLLEEDVTSDTIITSIKLTTGKKIEDVSEIYLTVFTYQNDNDFDSVTGRYIGGNFWGMNIGKISAE